MRPGSLFDLSGEVAIVTGGGDGIGKARAPLGTTAGAAHEKGQARLDY